MSDFENHPLSTWRAFIGRNDEYYLRQWGALPGDSRPNWAAFFFSAAWMLYRRMVRRALMWVVGGEVVELVLYYAIRAAMGGSGALTDAQLWKAVDRGVGLIVAIVFAAKANAWYLEHSRERLTAILKHNSGSTVRDQRVADAGGVSWSMVISGVILVGGGIYMIEKYVLMLPV